MLRGGDGELSRWRSCPGGVWVGGFAPVSSRVRETGSCLAAGHLFAVFRMVRSGHGRTGSSTYPAR